LAGALDDSRDASFADEHVMRFGSMNRVVGTASPASSDSDGSCDSVAIGEHREHEEVEPVVDRFVERVEDSRLVAVAALASKPPLRPARRARNASAK
jgi:hypothetical protein